MYTCQIKNNCYSRPLAIYSYGKNLTAKKFIALIISCLIHIYNLTSVRSRLLNTYLYIATLLLVCVSMYMYIFAVLCNEMCCFACEGCVANSGSEPSMREKSLSWEHLT